MCPTQNVPVWYILKLISVIPNVAMNKPMSVLKKHVKSRYAGYFMIIPTF